MTHATKQVNSLINQVHIMSGNQYLEQIIHLADALSSFSRTHPKIVNTSTVQICKSEQSYFHCTLNLLCVHTEHRRPTQPRMLRTAVRLLAAMSGVPFPAGVLYVGWVNGPISMLAVSSLSKAINIYLTDLWVSCCH